MNSGRWALGLQILVLATSGLSVFTSMAVRNEVLQVRIDIMRELSEVQKAARAEFPSRPEFEQIRERLNRLEARSYDPSQPR